MAYRVVGANMGLRPTLLFVLKHHSRGTLWYYPLQCSIIAVSAALAQVATHRGSQLAYQVILEPGIGQFREFEPRRVHTRINSLGLFLVHKLTCGKRESVS